MAARLIKIQDRRHQFVHLYILATVEIAHTAAMLLVPFTQENGYIKAQTMRIYKHQ
jgi:hypothetical protein